VLYSSSVEQIHQVEPGCLVEGLDQFVEFLRVLVAHIRIGAWARFADHLGALTADQQQFYDLAGVLGRGERQTTIVNTQVRRSAVE